MLVKVEGLVSALPEGASSVRCRCPCRATKSTSAVQKAALPTTRTRLCRSSALLLWLVVVLPVSLLDRALIGWRYLVRTCRGRATVTPGHRSAGRRLPQAEWVTSPSPFSHSVATPTRQPPSPRRRAACRGAPPPRQARSTAAAAAAASAGHGPPPPWSLGGLALPTEPRRKPARPRQAAPGMWTCHHTRVTWRSPGHLGPPRGDSSAAAGLPPPGRGPLLGPGPSLAEPLNPAELGRPFVMPPWMRRLGWIGPLPAKAPEGS